MIQTMRLLGHLCLPRYFMMHFMGGTTMLLEQSYCFSSFGDHFSLVGFLSQQVQLELYMHYPETVGFHSPQSGAKCTLSTKSLQTRSGSAQQSAFFLDYPY
uniref:Uncharacterized protein n=1 Tax=Opuntia streptacantha TaxID=393608 RepID=A0A7C8ZF49_OPUST